MTEGEHCVICDQPGDQLERCRTCMRPFCSECVKVSAWGRFCSDNCSRAFYYGDDEGDPDNEFDPD